MTDFNVCLRADLNRTACGRAQASYATFIGFTTCPAYLKAARQQPAQKGATADPELTAQGEP